MCRIILLLLLFSVPALSFAAEKSKKTPKDQMHHTVSKEEVAEEAAGKAEAEEHNQPISPWGGSKLGAGAALSSGNTNTANYNALFNINLDMDRWTNNAQGTAQFGRNDGVLNQEKYFLQDQVNYSLNDNPNINDYLFLSGNGTFDYFSPYSYQSVFAGGYGKDWVKTNNFLFNTQVGPGYRRSRQRDGTEAVESALIGTVQTNLTWNITENCVFNEQLRDDYGSQYNYVKSTTALSNKIMGNLGIQISYNIDYYSTIPPGSTRTEKLDTTTNINLVYNF